MVEDRGPRSESWRIQGGPGLANKGRIPGDPVETTGQTRSDYVARRNQAIPSLSLPGPTDESPELPWPDSIDMEGVAGGDPCHLPEASVLAQSRCPAEACRAGHQEPGSPPRAEVPYCDLPRRPPAPPEAPPGASASSCPSAVDPSLGPGPERAASAGLLEEHPTTAPGSRSWHPQAPYLEGLGPPLGGSLDETPGSGTSSSPDGDTPDDTSNSSSVQDWEPDDGGEDVPGRDQLTMMIPRKPQEGPRGEGARRTPSALTRAPAGDTAGQRKEDAGCGARSAGQRWAKLRGESGPLLERPRASAAAPPSGPRSATPQTAPPQHSAPRDTAFPQLVAPRAASPARSAQRDKPTGRSTHQDAPRAASARHSAPRACSPAAPAPQRSGPQPSPSRAVHQDSAGTSSGPQDHACARQCDSPRTACGQRGPPGGPSPSRSAPRDPARGASPSRSAPRDPARGASPSRSAPRDPARGPSPSRSAPRDPARAPGQQHPRTSPAQRDSSKASSAQWEKLRASCSQRDGPRPCSSRPDDPGGCPPPCRAPQDSPSPPPSPPRPGPRGGPASCSPRRPNKDIPWAAFPLRPTRTDGPPTSSPARPRPSEVPWAAIALRPTQGDRPQPACPARAAPGPAQRSSAPRNPGRTASPPHPAPRGAPQPPAEPSPPPSVCIGHRDAPRASSPPRYLQHHPFPFFPDPHAAESGAPHHDPPCLPPAVCIGHRDAPRASSPPRHAPFDPFPFLPDAAGAEAPSPQHEPPLLPPPVCIGHRDAPRASSPPRQAPEPPVLLQDLARASTESLAPSTDSLHEPPHFPAPVCIGHRDAPHFSSPPRQPPEPSLFSQDPPAASTESLAPSVDSLLGSAPPAPHVCIGHRDAPRASSPPRHAPGDLAFLACSPPPGSSGGSRDSAPGETRHNLEREEYTVLADLPPPRRLAQREPGPQGGNRGRTRSPGRAEVERLFGHERRKSEAPGALQARDEGRSQRPGQGQSQLLRRQSSPALGREVTKPLAKQAEAARQSREDPPPPRSPERRPEGDRWPQGSWLPPRTSARTPEREQWPERARERGRAGAQPSPGGWRSPEALPGARGAPRCLERSASSQEGGPGLGGWLGPEEPVRGASRTPEDAWRGLPTQPEGSWGQCPPRPAHWGSLQELPGPRQPPTPAEDASARLAGFSKAQRPETPEEQAAEGPRPPPHGPERRPELDWKDLGALLGAPAERPWARALELAAHLPRLYWEGLLGLLQAQPPPKDPAGASGPELGAPGTNGALEPAPPQQPEGWAQPTLASGHGPGQAPPSSAQPPGPSTQQPKTFVTSGAAQAGAGERRPPGAPGSPGWASEEPAASEPSRSQDSLTDQKLADQTLADSPDLLNFKKGWMSILDEPDEWKKHWFVLTDSSLKYYRDSTAEEADELDGEIDLRSCTDVTEYAVQRNYGFQIHTKDAVYTLSAMTSGIRRNWIEALRKTVRPTSAPDVTKLSDCNKENTLHGYGPAKGSLKPGEPRAGSEVIGRGAPRKADGQRPSLDYVELSPLPQAPGSSPRARPAGRALERPAKQEELERDLAQRSEERRRWFEATDSRAPEAPVGEAPRRGLGAPLTEDQQSRLSEEIEKKWQELEKLPLRESRRVPLSALLNQGRAGRRAGPSDSHEALEKEVQSLRAQLEAWRLRAEAPHEAPRALEAGRAPPGYISQEACERSLAEMESSHQQVMEELQRHHERELQRLQQEKELLLAEETAATASAIEAMKKAYQEELSRELSKTRSLQQGPDGLQKQHQSDMEALKRELQVLSEQYSQKCLEIGALTRQAEERERTLRRCQQEGQELLRHNQELHSRLSEEIDRLRGFIASQGTGNGRGRSHERSSYELEVLLRVKENELQYLKKEVQCLRDELQVMQKDPHCGSGKYEDVHVELSHIKTRSEREIKQLKEHLRLAMAALQEKEAARNSLAE